MIRKFWSLNTHVAIIKDPTFQVMSGNGQLVSRKISPISPAMHALFRSQWLKMNLKQEKLTRRQLKKLPGPVFSDLGTFAIEISLVWVKAGCRCLRQDSLRRCKR